jgi:hypothetical protein
MVIILGPKRNSMSIIRNENFGLQTLTDSEILWMSSRDMSLTGSPSN